MVRLKTRYLIVELDGPGKQKLSVKTKEDVTLIIRESVAKYYGDYGVGRTQYTYQVLYYSSHTRIGVVRCARELSRLVESSFFFVNGSAALEMRLRVVRECGCIRTCREVLLSLTSERVESEGGQSNNANLSDQLAEDIAAIEA